MASFVLTNLSSEKVHVGDFYGVELEPNGVDGYIRTLTNRDPAEVSGLSRVQALLDAGTISFAVQFTAAELNSGLMSPPNAIEAQDIQEVAAGAVAAVEQTFYKEVAATGAAADDVEIFAVDTLPYKFRVLDALFFVATSPGASTADLRDEPAGAGQDLGGFDQGTTGKKDSDALATSVVAPGATKGLFLRRSNGNSLGYVLVRVRRETP